MKPDVPLCSRSSLAPESGLYPGCSPSPQESECSNCLGPGEAAFAAWKMFFTMPVLPSAFVCAAVQRVSPEKGLESRLPAPTSCQAMKLQNHVFFSFGIYFFFPTLQPPHSSPLPHPGFRTLIILNGKRKKIQNEGQEVSLHGALRWGRVAPWELWGLDCVPLG